MQQWGIKCRRGTGEWWYGAPAPALGTEAEARDKAARRNDNDVEGVSYRAEPYSDECIGPTGSAFDCPVHDPRKAAPTT